METITKKQTKRKAGDIVHYNAIADRGGGFIATLERDNSALELSEFYHLSRRNSRGFSVSRGGSLVGVWDCLVVGGSMDGASCEFAIYEPASDL
jgi:hypothetical protein